jgi:putative spermidine/putrescine transport system ATP-binding protein
VEQTYRLEEVNAPAERFKELRISQLSRSFGNKFVALDKLDLTISGGEFVALLGPSGCGKSTALNLLAGLLDPTGGSIWLDDKRLDTVPSEKRDFGMVFQNYALFPHLSVADNVGFGLRIRRVNKTERVRRVKQALELVQLGSQADKAPSQLSGGQQQRVAIARAIVTEPRLVLMDEPLSNLDAKLRIDLRTEVRQLHQELGLTTVYVTHDQAEALSLADRLVVIREGVVQQVGSPMDIYENPTNAYVAAFVGYRNAIEGELVGGGRVDVGGITLRTDPAQQLPGSGHVLVMTRPDDVVIGGPVAPTENEIHLVVRVSEYQGRVFAIEGRTERGVTLFGQSSQALAPGDPVISHIAPERIRVYREDEMAGLSAADVELVASGAAS